MKASTRELLELVRNVTDSETLDGLRSVLYAMEAEARAAINARGRAHEYDWLRLREAIGEINERLEKANNSYEGGEV